MDPVVLNSARKHGISDSHMLHAYRHPIRVFAMDDLVMLVGADQSGRLLEVGVADPRALSSSFTPCPPENGS
jgi:hypothetical protein